MRDESRLSDLLLDWQEQYALGRDLPAAELCRKCPELAAVLEERIAVIRHIGGLARELAEAGRRGPDTGPFAPTAATDSGEEHSSTWPVKAAEGGDEVVAWLRAAAPPQLQDEIG